MGYLGELSQVAAGGRPLAVAAEVGREGGEGGAVREAARVVFESVGEGAGLGLPGAVGELEAGDQVTRAVLRGGGAPLAVELVAEQGSIRRGSPVADAPPTGSLDRRLLQIRVRVGRRPASPLFRAAGSGFPRRPRRLGRRGSQRGLRRSRVHGALGRARARRRCRSPRWSGSRRSRASTTCRRRPSARLTASTARATRRGPRTTTTASRTRSAASSSPRASRRTRARAPSRSARPRRRTSPPSRRPCGRRSSSRPCTRAARRGRSRGRRRTCRSRPRARRARCGGAR